MSTPFKTFEEWIKDEEPQYADDLTETELCMYRQTYDAESRVAARESKGTPEEPKNRW